MNISVIIPCYNRENSIRPAVLSVLGQVGNHAIEVIVVDDGSTDSSIERISDLDIKILKTEGRTGACNARNVGIKNAKFDLIAFNDSDDFWVINKLSQIENVLIENDNIDYIFHSFIRVKGNKASLGGDYLEFNALINKNNLFKTLITNNQISTQCLIIKKEKIELIDGFDVKLGRFQDWELSIRICKDYKGYYLANPLALCIESVDSISKSKTKGILAREYILSKHYDWFSKYPFELFKFRLSLLIRKIFVKISHDK